MATLTKCPTCGFPIEASFEGETTACANCGEKLEAISQGVTIPTWLLAGSIGLLTGIVLGPAILASTKSGQEWLVKQARGG